MAASIRERLAELYRRLQALPSPETAEAALEHICVTLDQVEDEWSGVPKNTSLRSLKMFDGRMYPPLPDHVSRLPDGGIVAVTRGHVIQIDAQGGFVITNKITGQVEFSK